MDFFFSEAVKEDNEITSKDTHNENHGEIVVNILQKYFKEYFSIDF